MIRWLKHPKLAEVANYVDCYWFLEALTDAESYELPKLNPDSSAHLIIALPEQKYHYQRDDEIISGKGCHWLYPHTNTFELDHRHGFTCIGIKFKVGALYSLSQLNAKQALIDTVSDFNFNDINRETSFDEKQLLNSTTESEDCCDILDKLLMSWVSICHEDKHSKLTRKILPLLANKPINQLGGLLFCSQRTIERSFLKVTGLTLKQCQSMNKLEAILEYLYQRKQDQIDWVDSAYRFGFSDQPHLIRYLKQQINLTPQGYLQQRGFTIDVYGGVDSKIK